MSAAWEAQGQARIQQPWGFPDHVPEPDGVESDDMPFLGQSDSGQSTSPDNYVGRSYGGSMERSVERYSIVPEKGFGGQPGDASGWGGNRIILTAEDQARNGTIYPQPPEMNGQYDMGHARGARPTAWTHQKIRGNDFAGVARDFRSNDELNAVREAALKQSARHPSMQHGEGAFKAGNRPCNDVMKGWLHGPAPNGGGAFPGSAPAGTQGAVVGGGEAGSKGGDFSWAYGVSSGVGGSRKGGGGGDLEGSTGGQNCDGVPSDGDRSEEVAPPAGAQTNGTDGGGYAPVGVEGGGGEAAKHMSMLLHDAPMAVRRLIIQLNNENHMLRSNVHQLLNENSMISQELHLLRANIQSYFNRGPVGMSHMGGWSGQDGVAAMEAGQERMQRVGVVQPGQLNGFRPVAGLQSTSPMSEASLNSIHSSMNSGSTGTGSASGSSSMGTAQSQGGSEGSSASGRGEGHRSGGHKSKRLSSADIKHKGKGAPSDASSGDIRKATKVDKDHQGVAAKPAVDAPSKKRGLKPAIGSDGKPVQPRFWTPQEHEKFLQAAKLFGHSNVHDIAKYVETRTVAQVRTHTQKYFVKLEKTGAKPVSQEDVQGCSQPQEPGSIAIKCSEVEGVSAADL